MPTLQMTDRGIARLAPLTGQQRTEFFDLAVPGLALRVSLTRRTWVVLYRNKAGRLRRKTLGQYPTLSLAAARTQAKDARVRAWSGDDPADEKREAREAETFGDLATSYLTKHAKLKKKSWRDDRRRIDNVLLPAWKHVTLAELTRADVRRLIDQYGERAPVAANRLHSLVRKMLNFAIGEGLIEMNVATHVARPGIERRRDRVLTDDEIRQVWAAFEAEPATIGGVFKLRLLTAQRGGEVVRMRWADVDLDAGWWTIPAEHSKNKLPHRVPLSTDALTILKARQAQRAKGAVWVFPSSHAGAPAVEGIRGGATRIGAAAKVADFRGHDLRRTAATRMASAGVARLVVGKILNHAEPGVTAVYDRASYDGEKRTALDAWGRCLRAILDKKTAHGKTLHFKRA
jgi:integrase